MRFIIIFLSLFLAQAAIADVEGETDPEYIAARDLWLSGDDLNGLRALSRVAISGNLAAQIFLAYVPPNISLHAVENLKLEERNAVFGMPNNRSGRSWGLVVRDKSPLARALSPSGINGRTETQTFIDHFEAAVKFEETRTLHKLIQLASTIKIGDAAYWSEIAAREDISPLLAPYTEHMAVFEQAREIAKDGDYSEACEIFDAHLQTDNGIFVNLSLRTLDAHGIAPERFSDVLFHAEQLRPYAAICQAYCPDEPRSCFEAISQTVDREQMFLTTLSPVETLLPTGTYAQSARYETDLLRQVLDSDSRTHRRQNLRIGELNSCAGSLLDRFEK